MRGSIVVDTWISLRFILHYLTLTISLGAKILSIIFYSRRVSLLSVSALVAACSNAVAPITPTTPGAPPSGFTYRTLADRVSTTGDSTLGGVIATEEGSVNIAMNAMSGTLNHTTGSTSLNAGPLAMVDADGPAGDGALIDGTNHLYNYTYNTGSNVPFFNGTYQYVKAFDGNYIAGGNVYNILGGTYGVVTGAADIPSAGTATYSGEAGGLYNYTGAAGTVYTYLTAGDSAVSADFSTNKVSVTMNNFTTLNSVGATVTQDVFDEVRLTNLAVIGNSFGGGNIAFYKNGTSVTYDTVIGANINALVGGNFYGYDSTLGAPDEVGGVLIQQGIQGTLNLVFVAD